MTDYENRTPVQGEERREPLFNAPPMAILIPVVLVTLYILQTLSPMLSDQLVAGFGLTPVLLRQGAWDLLVTHLFLHGSWTHVLINSAFCLAFATPLIRVFGRRIGGVASYLGFFLLSGIVAGAIYSLLNWGSPVPVIGASGAISGLMGGAIRLRERPEEGLVRPLLHPNVLTMTIVICGLNALSSVFSLSVGEGAQVAWQAHIAGYLFGLLAIPLWLKLFHKRWFTTK